MKKEEDKCFPFVFSRLCVRYLKKKKKKQLSIMYKLFTGINLKPIVLLGKFRKWYEV